MAKGPSSSNGNGRAAPPPRSRANPRRITAPAGADAAGAEEETRQVQAALEAVEITGYADFCGTPIKLTDHQPGLMPMLKFAHVATAGIGADDMEGMAAMYAVIRSVVDRGTPPCGDCGACTSAASANNGTVPDRVDLCPGYDEGAWPTFERIAIDRDADGETLLAFVGEAMAQISARPTSPRSGSSQRARTSSPKSKEPSPGPPAVTGRIIPPGAEDLRPVGDFLR